MFIAISLTIALLATAWIVAVFTVDSLTNWVSDLAYDPSRSFAAGFVAFVALFALPLAAAMGGWTFVLLGSLLA